MEKKKKILILEDDACFRNILQEICNEIGVSHAAGDIDSALSLLTEHSYQLLLLDWHLNDDSSLDETIEKFQTDIPHVALFTVPDLANVVAAMKAGACDILRAGQDRKVLAQKIGEALANFKPQTNHSSVSRFAETATEKALIQKNSFFKARRQFLKAFLEEVANGPNLRQTQLAELLGVSPRTLYRHLSA